MTIDSPALLERDGELGELAAALSDADERRGSVVLIEAAAGLGKTSLVASATDAALEAGFACLRARATELERDFAYGCVRQLLEPVVAAATPGDEGFFAGAAALARPLLTPSPDLASPPASDNSFAMLHGLYWLLNNLAERGPLALAVDDVQWADAESLRFFNYLAPRLDGLPIVVFASARSGEESVPNLGRLAAAPESTVLRPKPLSVAATAILCERRLGAPPAQEFATACREATGGNPFFIEALLRELRAQGIAPDASQAAGVWEIGPTAVAEAVLLRLVGRPEAPTALVRAIAVIGDKASLAETSRLAGLSESEAAEAADLLVGLAILKDGDALEFAHPIVREAVYGDIGPRHRAEAHASTAATPTPRTAFDRRWESTLATSATTRGPPPRPASGATPGWPPEHVCS